MSSTEVPAPAEPVPVVEDSAAPTDPPATETNGTAPEETQAPVEAPAPSSVKPKSAPKSSSNKKIARGRPSSGAGTSKKPKSSPEGSKSFEVGEVVLARLKGYPAWPARIADQDTLPQRVLASRPGKSSSLYCTQYFPAGDFSWLHSKDITPLRPHEIEAFLSEGHRKPTGGLKEAYKTAQDPTEWIANYEAGLLDIQEDGAEVDELEDEDEDEEVSPGGKRKRSASEKKEKKKAAKTAKKAKTSKSAEVVESEEDAEPKSKGKPGPKPKPVKAAPPKKEKTDSKPAVKPENQAAAADEDPLASDPEAVKVKDWRHKLQRAFLGKGLPTAEEMGTYDELFKTIESYDKMSIEYLQHSKIGKVMKKIATLSEIPRNEEFKITDRASKLMTEWTDFISNSEKKTEANGDSAKPTSKAEAAVNGDKMEVEA